MFGFLLRFPCSLRHRFSPTNGNRNHILKLFCPLVQREIISVAPTTESCPIFCGTSKVELLGGNSVSSIASFTFGPSWIFDSKLVIFTEKNSGWIFLACSTAFLYETCLSIRQHLIFPFSSSIASVSRFWQDSQPSELCRSLSILPLCFLVRSQQCLLRFMTDHLSLARRLTEAAFNIPFTCKENQPIKGKSAGQLVSGHQQDKQGRSCYCYLSTGDKAIKHKA